MSRIKPEKSSQALAVKLKPSPHPLHPLFPPTPLYKIHNLVIIKKTKIAAKE